MSRQQLILLPHDEYEIRLRNIKSRMSAEGVDAMIVTDNANTTLLMLDSQLETGERTLQSWDRSIRVLEALKRAGQANDVRNTPTFLHVFRHHE